MSEHEQDDKKAVMLLAEELIDDLLQTSDEELINEELEDSGSVEPALNNIRVEIDAAINSLRKDRLAEARAAIARTRQSETPPKFDAVEIRRQVTEILSSKTGTTRMTIAARNGKALSEQEIISAFSDLCQLRGFGRSVPKENYGSSPKRSTFCKVWELLNLKR